MINDITRINNTNYPTYDNNENCTWILETLPDKRIKLLITELSMESTRHCSYDAVTIYDGMYGTQEWNRTGRFCKRGQIGRVLYSTGSYMKIQFKTDSSRTRQGFVVMASSVCGGYSRLREGIIQSPRYPESYPRDLDCTWRIHVRPGRTIQVEFEDIDILSSDSSCPDNDYLTLRNGESNLSPLILINNNQGNSQNGRICGSTLPSKFNTSSNHLSISFKSSDSRVRRGNGFKLRYRELSISCGEFIHLSSHMKETILTSPNYPNVPQAHSECYWKIVTVPGKRIQLDFLESFDVKPSRGCNSAGVQLFDGLSEDATELGTFCRNKPSTIFSTGYMLYVRYYTFHDSPNNGFKARVKIATCGGTHYIGRRRSDFLTISSPDYPHHYKNNLACDWTIIGPSMHFLEVSFIELDLPSTSNCSDTDHLTIIDHERSFEAMSLGTFCGRGPQPPIESLGNNITIKFKSDQLNTERKGFLLRVKASFSHCGETVSGTSGIIKSVGYPNGDTHFRRCSYLINAPEGHKITFQFEDFDLNNNCHLTFIGVILLFLLSLITFVDAKKPTYTIIAPDVIRPNTDFLIAVSTHDISSDQDVLLTIKGLGESGDNIELTKETTVRPDETQIVRIGVGNLEEGKYMLHARGNSPLAFDHTQKLININQGYSVFVQTDKAIYRPGNVVKFRVIVVTPKLKPSVVGSIDVGVLDGKGHLVRQWDRVFTTGGVFAEEFLIDNDPVRGDWNITVNVSGQKFTKHFQVVEYVLPQIIVDIDIPKYGLFDEGLTSSKIKAYYPFGVPVKGEATVSIFPKYKSGLLQPIFINPIRKVVPIDGEVEVSFNIAKELNIRDDYSREIIFDVEIKEFLTDRVQNNTALYPMYKYDYKLEMVRTADAYKPGMPYTAYIKVAKQDNTPIVDKNAPIKLKWGFSNVHSDEYNTTTLLADENGIVTLTLDTPDVNNTDAVVLGIEASYKDLTQWFSTIPRAQSRSGLYLRSKLITKNPTVGETISIEITSSENIDSLTYLVFGRGKVALAITRKASGTMDNKISFRATSDMSPICRIIIYYVTSISGEIITDSMDFEVDGILTNFLSISSTKKVTSAASDVTINIKSKPNSFVGILAVDKSVRSLKGGHDVLLKEVTDELRRYDTANTPNFFPWFKFIKPNDGSLSWHTGSLNSEDTFVKSGTIIFTNGILEKDYTEESTNVIETEVHRTLAKNRPFGRPIPRPGVPTLNPDKGPGLEYESATRPPLEGPYAFSRFPRPLDNTPKIYLKNDLPETWLFLNATTDSNGRASIPVKAPEKTNTSWVISGFALDDLHGMGITEQFGSLEVFQPFYVQVDLPSSIKLGETLSVQMVVYNYLKEDIQASVTLEGHEEEFVFGEAQPHLFISDDNQIGSLISEEKEVVIRPGRGTIVSFSHYSSHTRRYQNENKSIPGSENVYISWMADPLISAMNNLNKLIRYPTGCGEQNMIRLVPTLAILEYIDELDISATHQRNKALKTMELGYQRELTMRMMDGSFSFFGRDIDDSGSTWVTALVIGNFLKASKYIDIDPAVIQTGLDWLAKIQNDEGAFPEKGKIYFSELQESELGLTAFVVSALFSQKEDLDANSKNALNRGISFIAKHWKDVSTEVEDNPYVFSIIAYALAKTNHPDSSDAFNILKSVAKRNETMGWEWLEAKIPKEVENNHWYNQSNSLNNQMTAYYALVTLKKLSRKNTYIGIEALKEFDLTLNIPNSTSKIDVNYSYLDNSRSREINPESLTISKRRVLPANIRNLTLEAQGTNAVGVVNVEYAYNLNVTASWPSFVLNPQLLPAPPAQLILNACVNYIFYSNKERSNMAVMEIDLPSGYTVDANSLPGLKRYEGVSRVETSLRNTRVIIYFQNIRKSEVCPTILGFRTYGVANQRPALIRVYDYYDQSRIARMFYQVRPATICEICSGEDCPEDGCKDKSFYPIYNPSYEAKVDPTPAPGATSKMSAYSQFEEYDIPIFGDHDRHTLCQRNPPSSDTTFKSLTNKLLIDFQTYSMIGRRGFKMAWTSEATTECGGEMGSSGVMSPILDPVSGNYTLPQLCTWKHVSDQENMTISYKSSNIQIRRFNNSLCMGDILIFDSAPSMTQDNSFQFCEPRSIEFFTSERLSRFTFIAAKSLELPQITNKGFNMSYRIHPCGGVISSLNGPQIITSPNYGSMDSHYSSGIDCVWKLHFEEGEQVALDFNSFDLQNSGQNCDNSDYLEIVNGPSNVKHPLLWKGCGVQLPDRRLISMRNYLWIHFHSNEDSITGRGFSISATPLQNGCGGIFHGFRGTFSIPSSGESKYEREMECIWDIKGTPGYQVSINFTDRFEVELTSGCTKDYLQIQYWNEDSSNWIQSGELICGRELPASILIPYHHVRLIFRSDNDVQGDGFSIRWELLCGGHYKEKKGEIASPGYPNNYHSNTHCNYYINASINDYVVINFQEPFELEEDPQCRYDSLSIYKVLSSNLIGKFCKHSPYPISTQGPVLIQFDTDYVIERAGFKLSYEIHSCGGNITQDGVEIASPLSPQTYRSNSNCTWFIKAPENQVVELKFNLLDLEASGDCFYDKVGIFDGHTLNATHELAKLCGNQSGIPIIKSNQNEMTVQFVSDNSFSAAGFKAMVRFTYGASSRCGGMINMTSLQSKLIKSVDANGDGNYEMDLNCQWTIFTGNDKILKLHFNAFDIENEENATFNKCWDFLKVFDGPGQFSSLIGEFCGNVIPSTTIQSSGNFMWINFFSDSTNVRGGFEALITVEDPICGSHTVMNATKEVQILTSPGYPNNYQSNLRCRWVIYGGSNDTQQTVHLNFLEFNIQSDSNCRQDRVHISDLNGLVSSSHGFNTSIIHSADRSYYLNYRWLTWAPWFKLSSFRIMKDHPKGFKLEYSLTSCNRTYDKSYGLLLSPNFPNVLQKNVFCDFNVTTVPSKTISVYFRVFSIPSSQNCSKSYLEVYDGLSLSSSTILRTCGYSIPIAIHSSGPSLRFKTVNTQYPSSGYEATYLTTDQGPGCGGRVMDSRGVVTSPNYPRDHSQDTDCTWTLSVPPGRRISLRLSLRFGYDLPCADNYLEVFDRDLSTNRRQLVSKYCGGDNPSVHEGPFNTVDLHYVTSANNTGGWKAHFQYVMN
ncbi:CD109 [Lepeophtheirus salmonis]|uniref:TEP1-F n=1 Tax=Lepeophtheirus salmonis TaxID=72036 RepID=A0A7R8CBF4_LEPSM|nr:CD109 [Lepeophtheirus salmonis]CAF2760160.1 CD109 [Lepeophtheirus salmonis]